jgi:queuine tRNA-ribosyltransferase
MFEIVVEDGSARAGRLSTRRGTVETPFFMPVITRGPSGRTIGPEDYHQLGAFAADCGAAGYGAAIANSLIASLDPGVERMRGPLADWLDAPCVLFTDSGGYQTSQGSSFRVERRDDGYVFHPRWNDQRLLLTPESSVAIQERLGSDVAMVLDDMAPRESSAARTREHTERTHAWARRALESRRDSRQLLFGICQGGMDPELRRHSARTIDALPFDGVAIGGIGILRPGTERLAAAGCALPFLSPLRPRYVMGVADPRDVVRLAANGVDCFDAAYPTILAGRALLVTDGGLRPFGPASRAARGLIDPQCGCATCSRLSLPDLVALYRTEPAVATAHATTHNLAYFVCLMQRLREAIRARRVATFVADLLETWVDHDEDARPPAQGW